MNRADGAALRPDGLAPPRRYWVLAGLWTGMAMSVIDASITNIALPSISRDLAVSSAATTWVVTAYQIAIIMTLLPVAALGERLGYHRVYLGGMMLFITMSLGCAMAPDIEVLAACRFLQGLGAAAMMGVNGAQMRFVWPKELLGRGIGYNTMVIACTAAAGPVLAGLILSLAGWPWLFLVNVPVGVLALALVARFAPGTPAVTKLFDWPSALLTALMFGALFLAGSEVVHGGSLLWLTGWAIAGVFTGVLLVRRVRPNPRPMIPFDLIGIGRMRRAYGASICAFTAQMSLLVSLPFLLEGHVGLDVAMVGLLVLPLPLAVALISPVAGRLGDSNWAGRMSAAGLCLTAAALAALAWRLPSGMPLAGVALCMGLSGIGFGLFQSPNNNVMLRAGPIERAGAAAGMMAQCRLLGQTAGALIAALTLRFAEAGSSVALYAAAIFSLCAAAYARGR